MSRKAMGHTETVILKLHPTLKAHVANQAEQEFCTVAEYLRRLIIVDMRLKGFHP